jgi:hypothetical protein
MGHVGPGGGANSGCGCGYGGSNEHRAVIPAVGDIKEYYLEQRLVGQAAAAAAASSSSFPEGIIIAACYMLLWLAICAPNLPLPHGVKTFFPSSLINSMGPPTVPGGIGIGCWRVPEGGVRTTWCKVQDSRRVSSRVRSLSCFAPGHSSLDGCHSSGVSIVNFLLVARCASHVASRPQLCKL